MHISRKLELEVVPGLESKPFNTGYQHLNQHLKLLGQMHALFFSLLILNVATRILTTAYVAH